MSPPPPAGCGPSPRRCTGSWRRARARRRSRRRSAALAPVVSTARRGWPRRTPGGRTPPPPGRARRRPRPRRPPPPAGRWRRAGRGRRRGSERFAVPQLSQRRAVPHALLGLAVRPPAGGLVDAAGAFVALLGPQRRLGATALAQGRLARGEQRAPGAA